MITPNIDLGRKTNLLKNNDNILLVFYSILVLIKFIESNDSKLINIRALEKSLPIGATNCKNKTNKVIEK